jgi:SPP1 gp7 family putative phage head morphogenesis protein
MPRKVDPILSANKKDPANQSRRIKAAMRSVSAVLDETQDWLLLALDQMPVSVINAKRYDYLVDLSVLRSVVSQIAERIKRANRPMQQAATAAYAEGTAQASVNLSRLSEDYARPVTSVLASEPYLRRSSLVGARVFEEMEGFAAKNAADLARILMTGVEEGRNPRVVAREIRDQFGVSKRRAETIARTEITGALRRGRLDEEKDAQERLGINTGMLWQSALSPTTRDSHAERHGRVYTIEEIEEFYSQSGEGINCKCSFAAVLLDDDGNPISDKLVERMAARRDAYLAETSQT